MKPTAPSALQPTPRRGGWATTNLAVQAWTASVLLAVTASIATGTQPDFANHWHDGRAELDAYEFTVIRYGQSRSGQAVMVYVTEPFSRSKTVKVNDPSRDPQDTFEVLKLNFIRDFQTGIYDYNTMVSVFTQASTFEPVKITFTSAEWCGHIYEELRFEPKRIAERFSSYFENESSSGTLDRPKGGVTEDNLFILLRGLRGPWLEPGQEREVPFLAGSFYRRLTHRAPSWGSARIRREPEPQTVTVPAGRFPTIVYQVTTDEGRTGRFFVEQAYPHRIVRWSWQPSATSDTRARPEAAETGQLAGTARLKYWQLHDNGHERHLAQLGLRHRAADPRSQPPPPLPAPAGQDGS